MPRFHPCSLTTTCKPVVEFDSSVRALLVNQLERELNLARGAGRLADHTEAGVADNLSGCLVHLQRVRRQSHVDDIEDVEELGTELQVHALGAALSLSDRRVLDHGEI